MIDPVELLARTDKWYLSAGDGIIFAPPFPLWLDFPGFWDEATVYQYAFGPLFTLAILDEDGRELPLRATARRWTPADLTVEYRLPNGVTATEVRTVQPGGIFVSEWRLQSLRTATVHLVAWTAQDGKSVPPESVSWDGALTFTRSVRDQRNVPLAITAELACAGGASSWCASLSEAGANHPYWRYTPFVEQWASDGLPCDARLEGRSATALVYCAVHRALAIGAGGAAATFAMRLVAGEVAPRRETAASAIGSQHAGTLGGVSRRRWQEFFSRAPAFRCSDPYLEHYYWYRWYGLWLNAIAPGRGYYRHPAMCEGIGPLHQPASQSAPCHVRELRWLSTPDFARGVLRTFFSHQKDDGSVHGRIYANHLSGTGFYHANWGDALLAVDAAWPDGDFLREMYDPMARYAGWLARTHDADESGMFDTVSEYETGHDLISRYEADDGHAGKDSRKGVEVTVYAYALFTALGRIALRAGRAADAERWDRLATRTAGAVRELMWDADEQMFFDLDSRHGDQIRLKTATCFYPYFTDLATAEHLAGLEQHLFDPEEFWTAFPVPLSSPGGRGHGAGVEGEDNSPVFAGSGRVWPIINSHLVECLARGAQAYAPHLRARAVQLMRRFVRMMFHDGELGRPNSFEHYNPLTGHASMYRGMDDHQQSWINDLIIQYVMGIRPHEGGITIDPFPFGLEFAELTGAEVRGAGVSVRLEGERVVATVDGVSREGRIGTRMEVARG